MKTQVQINADRTHEELEAIARKAYIAWQSAYKSEDFRRTEDEYRAAQKAADDAYSARIAAYETAQEVKPRKVTIKAAHKNGFSRVESASTLVNTTVEEIGTYLKKLGYIRISIKPV